MMSQRSPIYSTAVSSKRSYEVKPIMVENQPTEPYAVNVAGYEQPVNVVFHTQSSPMIVRQVHRSIKPAEVERTSSMEEPHRVVHAVMRPIIQEIREIIQPYRRLTQEIRPVLEEIRTVVSKPDRSKSKSMPMTMDEYPTMSYASSNQHVQHLPQQRYNQANIGPSYRHQDMMAPIPSNTIKYVRMNRDYGVSDQFGQTGKVSPIGPPILMASSGLSLNYRQQMPPHSSSTNPSSSSKYNSMLSNNNNIMYDGNIPMDALYNLKLNRNRKPRSSSLSSYYD
ncbi:hypothetical protein BLA29_007214 [Euroglyphus maynei]|uniref:DFP2-like protein n=1 Tax=Euroglyphus maynei TaxID=6958 RepID=A0A1Y3AM05_EURMA|nr:hypothetical protein BLA29_007214 [Euroglyphus maynei]